LHCTSEVISKRFLTFGLGLRVKVVRSIIISFAILVIVGYSAAFTTLPVIAVPLRSSLLDGLDSVLSMLQMPNGVPVATVSVNGARNAAILACQIISLHNENIRHQFDKLKTSLAMNKQRRLNQNRQLYNTILFGALDPKSQ
jgi:phosphoribosylaminoimidazole carboxylase PurE protein